MDPYADLPDVEFGEHAPVRPGWVVPAAFMLIAVIIAMSAMLLATSGSGSASIGRSSVSVVSGSQVRAGISGGSTDNVSWTARSGGGTVLAKGSSSAVAFTAPKSGRVILDVSTSGMFGTSHKRTTFRVVARTKATAWDVSTSGRVRVNGGPAVSGEALMDGDRVDASRGEISMQVHATENSELDGTLTLTGTDFTVSKRTVGEGRVLNTIGVNRQRNKTVKLAAEVEHLDGVRYVAVQTPDAVAMVKGTAFTVEVGPEFSSVSVEHGIVFVLDRTDADAPAVDLTAGEERRIDNPNASDPAAGPGGMPADAGAPLGTDDDRRVQDAMDDVVAAGTPESGPDGDRPHGERGSDGGDPGRFNDAPSSGGPAPGGDGSTPTDGTKDTTIRNGDRIEGDGSKLPTSGDSTTQPPPATNDGDKTQWDTRESMPTNDTSTSTDTTTSSGTTNDGQIVDGSHIGTVVDGSRWETRQSNPPSTTTTTSSTDPIKTVVAVPVTETIKSTIR